MPKIKWNWIFLCFFFQAEGLEESNEVVLFSQRMGFKFLNIINFLSESEFESYHFAVQKHFRSRVLKPSELSAEDLLLDMDTTVILSTNPNLTADANEVLKHVKIGSLIWFITQPTGRIGLTNFLKSVNNLVLNLKFFICFKEDERRHWKEVFKLNTNTDVVLNNIELHTDPSVPVIVQTNLQGLSVSAISISWAPLVIVGDCKNAFKNCETSGIVKDLIQSVAKEYNFTVEVDREPDSNWGLNPVSGPRNLSGEWTGVVGGLVNKDYQIVLSTWVHSLERTPIMDMIPFGWVNEEVLLIAPLVARVDSGLYTRPFDREVWFALGGIIFLGGVCILVISIMRIKQVWSKRIALLSLSYFFVLLESYYGGALTMFFSTESTLPFESIHDVLKSYPDWKLLIRKDSEILFRIGGEAGDVDYAKYYNFIQTYPEAFTYTDLSEAINRIKNKKEVVHSWHFTVSNLFMEKPTLARGIKQFARFSPRYPVFALQKNSPMTSILKRGFLRVKERGITAHFVTRRLIGHGQSSSSTTNDESTMVLEVGDVFLVFALISGTIVCSITLLAFEYLAHLLSSKRFKHFMMRFIFPLKPEEEADFEWKCRRGA